MKSLRLLLFFVSISALTSSCLKDHCKQQVRMYFPIYKAREVLLSEVKLKVPQTIVLAGKIFSYGNYLFINDVDKGIHIIDNSNPASPNKIGFLNLEGNIDLWVKKNLLYADCYDNLLVLDISDIHNIRLVETLPNIFPQRNYNGATLDATKGYVVGWEQKDTTLEMDCKNNTNGLLYGNKRGAVYTMELSASGASSFIPPSGLAGSLTRFNVTGDFLYCIDNSTIHTFNISLQKPLKLADVALSWGLETIFSFDSNLYIGTSTGVLIYSLITPATPIFVNKMEHVRTCDPVITDGHNAFLTLRGGSACGGFNNQMDVLDVNNLKNVSLLKSYPLTSPYGLGMDDNHVFVCDEGYGVRVFTRTNVLQMLEINKIVVEHPRDIIVLDKTLLILTDTKMVQYDYQDINNIKFLSQIN